MKAKRFKFVNKKLSPSERIIGFFYWPNIKTFPGLNYFYGIKIFSSTVEFGKFVI
jgi:hypothetical protein